MTKTRKECAKGKVNKIYIIMILRIVTTLTVTGRRASIYGSWAGFSTQDHPAALSHTHRYLEIQVHLFFSLWVHWPIVGGFTSLQFTVIIFYKRILNAYLWSALYIPLGMAPNKNSVGSRATSISKRVSISFLILFLLLLFYFQILEEMV